MYICIYVCVSLSIYLSISLSLSIYIYMYTHTHYSIICLQDARHGLAVHPAAQGQHEDLKEKWYL